MLVEIDSGHHRSGVDPARAGVIANAAARAGLDVAGVFTFPGHSYAPGRQRAANDESRSLAGAVDSLAAVGITPRIVSGGSTPSAEFADGSILTEIRPGVYVFGDAQQWELGTTVPDAIALSVVSTVVSSHDDHLIADAGSKMLAADRGAYSSGCGRLLDYPEARLPALSEHHATISGVTLQPGTRVRVVPNHSCVAVNLAHSYVVVRDGEVVAHWPVDARGANR